MNLQKNFPVPGLYGLAFCGGFSTRMGSDKAMLQYYEKPQCYHVYDMLRLFCEKVFIVCNEKQEDEIDPAYHALTDLSYYGNSGPIAGLLSSLTAFPHKNFLIAGCDYPFLTKNDLAGLLPLCNDSPVAFYNEDTGYYEPVLAYYPHSTKKQLLQLFESGQYSLQSFLKNVNATKYIPINKRSLISVDTREAFIETTYQISLLKQPTA